MSFFAPPAATAEAVDLRTLAEERRIPALVASRMPAQSVRPSFAFRQSILPVEAGRLLLRLRRDARLLVSPDAMEVEVEGWGITMPHYQTGDLPRVMARRFLELFSKAETDRLTPVEQENWAHVLDMVDFQRFCVDRATPHYLEGRVVDAEMGRVEWTDGSATRIANRAARQALRVLDNGDWFGAHVKLGLDDEVVSIERVVLIEPHGEV